MDKQILGIYNSLQEIAWDFGSRGMNGECCEDLSFIEFMALKKISENAEISVQEVGNYLNITKSGATKIINRLEQKGYATRKTSPADGRVCCVCITVKGTEVMSRIIGQYINHIEAILRNLEPGTINEIESALRLFSGITKS
ncbi:MarR family winged helix-turn-helix transcriptional regulator [Sinanaerobacter chloroacetimidivorans]|uniref:MarR family transcriptional regulator n=1 Tax=Sinanaerobacter chloroacetimidivorans TaxID=2818044 RepID=A0A8J8B2B8_9FIRM|nr:MarR family transcriptional regulator [Sinanaerobacter chloroacetimidivorans]MBR0598567.1 MarR family transcriptional regulator [Sinanaerobacter chloroacetimidivorans]